MTYNKIEALIDTDTDELVVRVNGNELSRWEHKTFWGIIDGEMKMAKPLEDYLATVSVKKFTKS